MTYRILYTQEAARCIKALDGTVIIRDMQSGVQETVSQEKVVEELKKRFKK